MEFSQNERYACLVTRMHAIIVEVKIDNVDIIKVLRLPHLNDEESVTESSGEDD